MRDKIIEMLGDGYSQTVVAAAIGVSDSYISQLVAEPEVAELIQAKRVAKLDGVKAHDDGIDSLEKDALAKMHRLLPFVTKPMEVVRIFEAANSAKRKHEQTGPQNVVPTTTIVQVQLPAAALSHFKISTDRQVVEVEGRSMNTLPAKNLNEQLKQRQEARKNSPLITDASSAANILENLATPIPKDSIANVL